jgi:hypothetical protein
LSRPGAHLRYHFVMYFTTINAEAAEHAEKQIPSAVSASSASHVVIWF